MYYAPRLSPEKPGMPVLGYFVVVGTVLTAMLFVADAAMTRPERVSFVSNFDGLPAEFKGESNSRRPAPAPAIASIAPVAETTGSAPAKEQHAAAPQPAPAQDTAKPVKPQRKIVHKRQRQDDDDGFGGNGRRDFAFSSRDPFASREREPSWRDSWASGGFDQPRETRSSRRSAPRPNGDFWSFR